MLLSASGLDDLPQVARTLVSVLPQAKVIAFHGNMGAGKTTLIKALCNVFGVKNVVNSPTFALVNEYGTDSGKTIYHFDFYRIERIEEVYDLGYEEYFYSNRLCLIEWPEKIMPLLPSDTVHIYINVLDNGTRTFKL